MAKSSPPSDEGALILEPIIGPGESSFRENYFPDLQKKIFDLEHINNRYKTLIDTIPDTLLVGDGETLSVFSSSSIKNAGLVQKMLRDKEISQQLIAAAAYSRKENTLVTKNFCFFNEGNAVYFEARVNSSGENESLIIIRDMTAELQLQTKLREMALQDSMTNLYNRGYFEEFLLEFDGKPCHNLSIILLDIDGLKIVNDTLGHIYGDQILISVSNILREVFHQANCIARIGGDEFGILLDGYNQKNVEILLRNMNQAIARFNHDHMLLPSVSFGYSYMREGIADLDMMFRDADNKMFQNKLLKENSNRSSIVKALTKTLEVKDFITEGHAHRMEKLAIIIGKSMQLPQDQMDRIVLLTKFHDIGKVGIPDSILMKPGRLTESEWETMKSHSVIGKRIADASPELHGIAQLILLHHERWDGAGYPIGLKADEIPVECGILSIVDAFDAMTNDRPYRSAKPYKEAVREIMRCAGTQFNKRLVQLFCDVVDFRQFEAG